ncbi:MAG: hypothetical protein HC838_16300 [Spirulinaceae cyanobacterium RM2_2_10]|nr:hypothetical protein [Spirulinaceae cyanobacterium SM2_1_0]NJO21286.1 hypothetical protein [Spirulinaceae cyanobacterium RM2_2_10]
MATERRPSDDYETTEARVAATHPMAEGQGTIERDPDIQGAALGLKLAPTEPVSIKEDLEARDRQRLEGSQADPH